MMDSTQVMSASEHTEVNAKGYNNPSDFGEQLRLMCLFSAHMKLPVYYRFVGGNITYAAAMALCVEDMGLSDMVCAAGKARPAFRNEFTAFPGMANNKQAEGLAWRVINQFHPYPADLFLFDFNSAATTSSLFSVPRPRFPSVSFPPRYVHQFPPFRTAFPAPETQCLSVSYAAMSMPSY
jgi:hypothetical protein